MKKIIFNTLPEKIILILSMLIPIAGFGMILHGVWKIGDLFGGILFSSLPISLLSVIILIIAQSCKKLDRYSKIIWIISSIYAFLAAILCTIYYVDGSVTSEGVILIFCLSIYILGLPCSLIFISFIIISVQFISGIYNGIYYLIIMWLALYFSMYMQWFVIFPWILRDAKVKDEHIKIKNDVGST